MTPLEDGWIAIESLDHEGKGVGHRDGKVVFVEGALPGEEVRPRTLRAKASHEVAVAEAIRAPSSQRVVPACAHFGVCGGCSLQHLNPQAQVAAKQRVLEDCLARIGGVRPDVIFPAIHGPAWEYRYRARLSVRNVVKKGGVLVGFHERRSSFVADMSECRVLPQRISDLLGPLRELIGSLSLRDRLPQIELAIGDGVDVLVLRLLNPLSAADTVALRQFGARHGIALAIQPKGPETIIPFHPEPWPELDYTLPEFDLRLRFSPTEFTQVNHQVNRVLVRRAMALLDPGPGEHIADMFCGLGNFSLPIARRGATVLGVEGSTALVARAASNAALNGLSGRASFLPQNLFTVDAASLARLGRFDKMLIDPPRDGALDLVKALEGQCPDRIVYVSCNPATLARDAGMLVHVLGYHLSGAGVVNMFPHTAHVESVALFDRPPE